MNLDWVTARVGRARWDDACAWAWRTAAGTGQIDDVPRDWPGELEDVPHDVGELIWNEGEAPAAARVDLTFAAYRAMPCYALLVILGWEAGDGPDVLAGLRDLLDEERDELADPVAYHLWVDHFDGGGTRAWDVVAALDGDHDRRIERVLGASGPVAWAAKEALYEQLVHDERWHPWIFRSILHSAFDVLGAVDKPRARRWLGRLTLPEGTEHVGTLWTKLSAG